MNLRKEQLFSWPSKSKDMESFQLPKDGSVVIIDDVIEEALPLIQVLAKKGISSTYYSGTKDSELPDSPSQKIRLAFIDIQLFPAGDAKSYTSRIMGILEKLISDDNGPYLLIVWSKHDDVFKAELERQITADKTNKRCPILFLCLSKNLYLATDEDASIKEIAEAICSSLKTRFGQDDLDAIIKAITGQPDISAPLKHIEKDALDNISTAIYDKIKEAEAFNLFTTWENCVNKASGQIVKSFSSIYPTDEHWRTQYKFRYF